MTQAVALAQLGNSGVNFRNRIINGDMRIDQRNSAASPITSGSRAYAVDRWSCEKSGAGAFTLGQSSTAPTGFQNSLLATVTTADTSIASGDIYWFEHRIEGYNFADLAWGTANAKTATLSFWVRSSVAGTYSVAATYTASKSFEYTINSVNTWEYKTIVITGPQNIWAGSTTNGTGMNFRFALAVGSNYAQSTSSDWTSNDIVGSTNQVNWMNTLGNTFYITGVQLEVGSAATAFEYRPYATELALCQRYCWSATGGSSSTNYTYLGPLHCNANNSVFGQLVSLPVTMRANPTISSSGTFVANTASGSGYTLTALTFYGSKNQISVIATGGSASLVAGNASGVNFFDTNTLTASAEL